MKTWNAPYISRENVNWVPLLPPPTPNNLIIHIVWDITRKLFLEDSLPSTKTIFIINAQNIISVKTPILQKPHLGSKLLQVCPTHIG